MRTALLERGVTRYGDLWDLVGDAWLSAEELQAQFGPGPQYSRLLTATTNARNYLEGIISAPTAEVEDVPVTVTAPPPPPHPTSTFHQDARSHPDLAGDSYILYSDGGPGATAPAVGALPWVGVDTQSRRLLSTWARTPPTTLRRPLPASLAS